MFETEPNDETSKDDSKMSKSSSQIPSYEDAIKAVKKLKRSPKMNDSDSKDLEQIRKLNEKVFEKDLICFSPWFMGTIGILLLTLVYYHVGDIKSLA